MTRGEQGGFYLQDDLLLGYSQGHVAQMVVEQKQTQTLKFQNEETKKKKRYIHQEVAMEGYKEGSKAQLVICSS
jgi:hypothetical protein